ncbi:MAG: glycosyl transferase, partial [Bacteroidetes bacterium]|nr:glycosyl transferase [Bacteroidota bacterium]
SKDTIVLTSPQHRWKSIINQRVRWASKTSKQRNLFTKGLGVIVFLSNLFVLIGLLFCVFNTSYFGYFIAFLFSKLIVDYWVLFQTSAFYRRKISIPYFLISTLIYPIITVIAVIKALKGSYIWKERTFN